MKITISCSGGTFRGFFLASRLAREGVLDEFFTPYSSLRYPWLKKVLGCPDAGQTIGPEYLQTDMVAALARKLVQKTGLDRWYQFDQRAWSCDMIDQRVARRLRSGADVVFAESVMAFYTLRRAKELGALAVVDRTNSHILFQSEIMQQEYDRLGMKRVYNSARVIEKSLAEYEEADYISVLSSFVKRTFLERGVPEKKLLLIPSGVSLEEFRPLPKEDGKFRVIYCGLACIKKGVHYLLEAFAQLNLPNSELWLLGQVADDLKPFLVKYSDRYRLFGYIPYSELSRYYSQGSVFVLPSLEEGLAKVMMEAMACGLPVIATPNTGAEDVMDDGREGFLTPARDVQTLVSRIEMLYRDDAKRRWMGENARRRVAKGSSLEDYVARFMDAMRSVLAEKHACR